LHGLQPNVRFEANTLPLMTDLVIAGLGYTVLPACGVRHLVKQRQVSATPIADLSITWLVARPKTRSLGVAAERFHDMLCEFGRKQVRDGVWDAVDT
jgi:LysR family nitrogen assimilation transcriptional regulator